MVNFKNYKLEQRLTLTQAFMMGLTTGFVIGFYLLGRLVQ